MSKKEDRINGLVTILKESNGASVKELAAEFRVSEMTIRRDLKTLEEKNIIDNFYGVAVFNHREDNPLNLKDENEFSYTISKNSHIMEFEKNKIGKKAVEFIEDGDVIAIDVGTTTEKLAQNIENNIGFTALIFSANNLIHLLGKQNVKIVLPGGSFHRDTGMFESLEGLSIVDNTRTTKLFLSAAGIHDKLGLTCAYPYEVAAKKRVIKNSLEVILLADSTKFGNVSPAFICDIDCIDKIITDFGISEKWIKIIKEKGIELIIV